MKRDHQIAIVPSAKFGQGDEAIFKFRCQRSNIDFLGTARDSLEEFLGLHNVRFCIRRRADPEQIQVYPSNAHKRIDSFADAFSHFNSKLLATGANVGGAHSPFPPCLLIDGMQRVTANLWLNDGSAL